ncbi:MAG: hypothetical protein ACE1Y3_04385 [Rhodospirillales bacterium]
MRYLAVVAVLFLGLALPARAGSHLEGVARAGMVVGTKIENFDAVARAFKLPERAKVGLAKEVVIEQDGGGHFNIMDVRRVPGSGRFDIVFTEGSDREGTFHYVTTGTGALGNVFYKKKGTPLRTLSTAAYEDAFEDQVRFWRAWARKQRR